MAIAKIFVSPKIHEKPFPICGLLGTRPIVGIMAPKYFESRGFLLFWMPHAKSEKKEVLTRISGGQTTENTKGLELGDFKILHQYSI